MACPRCSLRLIRQSKQSPIQIRSRRGFHISSRHQRLGAFTYAQEWTTGIYHYNKSLAKTLPIATNHVDNLLTAYATQQKRRVDPSNPLYKQITKTNITSQRRQPDRVFISKSTAKDFGDRMEVKAFVFDGVGAAEAEKEAKMKKRMGVKEGEGAQGNKRGPAARRRVGGGAGGGNMSGASRAGPRRIGSGRAPIAGQPVRRAGGGAGGGLVRRV